MRITLDILQKMSVEEKFKRLRTSFSPAAVRPLDAFERLMCGA